LPADDSNLTHLFDYNDYVDVITEDNVYSNQGGNSEYMVFLFKDQYDTSTGFLDLYCRAKSSLAPSTSSVYLQVYNRNTGLWETVDTESAAAADTKFTLNAIIDTNLSDYYDANRWVSCRIYQLGV